ncbi:Zinc knuckle CX2CX4HX4C [Trema orientale]|uniref:Zinc knuckle CX2CX4HX4C n=1 Tax=Trema orientale TaxID=63057 RepID=A0A2P5FRM2_TREOI|nr:Zinc knuckle CX2CX4HX4C [Trema orientale]
MSEVEADKNGHCYSRFARVRVWLDVTNPLKRTIKVCPRQTFETFWADLRYKKLLDFSFICGHMGHIVRDCRVDVDTEWTILENFKFGNWLKASTGPVRSQPCKDNI